MLQTIIFVPDPQYNTEEEVRSARRSMEEDGFATDTCRAAALPAAGKRCRNRSAENRGKAADGTLYLTDSTGILQQLQRSGLCCAGWRHAQNADEDLSAAAYVIEDPAEVWDYDFERIYCREARIPWTILKTERLTIREFGAGEGNVLTSLGRDREAARFLGPVFGSAADADARLQSYIDRYYRFYGFGCWALCLQESGKVIGCAGFSFLSEQDAFFPGPACAGLPQLGYLTALPYRRCGFAREACTAIVDYGFRQLDFREICALTAHDNDASLHLLRSLGFTACLPESSHSSGDPVSGSAGPASDSPVPRVYDLLHILRPASS